MTKMKNKTTTETKDISFNPQEMEPRWQKKWEADKLYRSVIDESRPSITP
jgi:leucyl-tRNA synthetase